MGRYKYLSIEQRRTLSEMFQNQIRPKEISKALGIHLATVYRELERYKSVGKYDAEAVQIAVAENMKRRGRTRAKRARA